MVTVTIVCQELKSIRTMNFDPNALALRKN